MGATLDILIFQTYSNHAYLNEWIYCVVNTDSLDVCIRRKGATIQSPGEGASWSFFEINIFGQPLREINNFR